LAVGLLAMASLRLDGLGSAGPAHPFCLRGCTALFHWSPIVAPAEMVRRGGWLLWGVPSQYGFLNTVAVAWMPFRSVWQAFYVVHAALTFASGCAVFALFRLLRKSPANLALSLAMALASVFMVPGWAIPGEPLGPWVTPAVGGYRFIWCHV